VKASSIANFMGKNSLVMDQDNSSRVKIGILRTLMAFFKGLTLQAFPCEVPINA